MTTRLERDFQLGFTLLELTVSMSMLLVVSMLTLLVTSTSSSAVALSEAKETAQSSVRDSMTAMTAELALASKKSNTETVAPLSLQSLQVVNPGEIVFQVPLDSSGELWSTPITYRFVDEDIGEGEYANNGQLDPGEDTDGDGALTRRIVRIQGDTQMALCPANDLSGVQFALSAAGDVLTINVSASKAVSNRRRDLVTATASSRVYLTN